MTTDQWQWLAIIYILASQALIQYRLRKPRAPLPDCAMGALYNLESSCYVHGCPRHGCGPAGCHC